jgi:hypothetical protein
MEIRKIILEYSNHFPIFASSEYLALVSKEYGWFGGFGNGKLVCALPYIVKKKFIFKWIQFQTETLCINPPLSAEEEKYFLNSVIDFLRKENIDFIVQPPPHALSLSYPDGSFHVPFGSYAIDLLRSEEELWKNVQPRTRRAINEATQENIVIKIDTVPRGVIHSLLKETMERSGMNAISRGELDRLLDAFPHNAKVFTAFHNDIPQGCVVFFFSTCRANALYGGSAVNALRDAGKLMYWESIKYFKSLGVRSYDFSGARLHPKVGSKQEGIQRFKEHFGASLRRGYLWKFVFNRPKYLLYSILYRVRNRGVGDIIDQEIHSMRNGN